MDKIKISKKDREIVYDIYFEIIDEIRAQYKSGDSFNSCFSLKKLNKEKEEYTKQINKIKNAELRATMITFLDNYVEDVKKCLDGLKIFNSAHRKLKTYGYCEYFDKTFGEYDWDEHSGN
jgi:hypothetical protein